MEFGVWVQRVRMERALDLRAFAALTGVDATTISRIERGAEATLSTVIRICEGVHATLADLLWALEGKPWPNLATPQHPTREVMPTIGDIEAFLISMRSDWQAGRVWLAALLNRITSLHDASEGSMQGSAQLLFVPEDIDKLLLPSSLYQFALQYPASIQAKDIADIYRSQGVLTLTDIGVYVKKVRRSRKETLSGIKDAVQLSASALSRLETGAMERIKFNDVMILDKQLGQEGLVIGMYWSVYSFTNEIVRQQHQMNNGHVGISPGMWIEREKKLVTMFTIMCRWLQALSHDTSWADELRSQIHQQQVQGRRPSLGYAAMAGTEKK
jgi:transcriptional regulator with XRE-family HTH domain